MKRKILATAISALALTTLAPVAHSVDVSASAAIASSYLWRGNDLGDGDAAVSGDLVLSEGGLYGGVWISSGDSSLGTEYDLFVGYGGEVGDFSYDLSYWTYAYPDATAEEMVGTETVTVEKDIDPGEAAEVIGTIGYGPVSYSLYYDASKDAEDADWTYMTLSADLTSGFGATIGKHNDSLLHGDLSYSYNDNLGFTLSVPLDEEEGAGDPKFVVSYSLPLEF